MKAEAIKNSLTESDIFDLLDDLGGAPIRRDNQIYSRTICHHGNKHKLTYRDDLKNFRCWTDCSCSYDVFSLVGKIFDFDFSESFLYICKRFNIKLDGSEQIDINPEDYVDNTFIKKFKKKTIREIIIEPIKKTLLNSFYKLYHESWIEDGISIRTMKKFDILFSIRHNKIIIPHFSTDNSLIGIRGRALNSEEIEEGRKYMPVFHKGEVRKHLTGANIYGVNITKENIKKNNNTIILFEAEKGVLQLDTMHPEMSIGGGISGSYITDEQIKILLDLGIENVILGLDKEFEEHGSDEEFFYRQKVRSAFLDKLLPYFHVSLLWDSFGLLDYKDAPTDKGKDVFDYLYKHRIVVN